MAKPSTTRSRSTQRGREDRTVQAGRGRASRSVRFDQPGFSRLNIGECVAFPYEHPTRFPALEPRRTALLTNRMSEAIKGDTAVAPFGAPLGSLGVMLIGVPGLSYMYSASPVPYRQTSTLSTNSRYRVDFLSDDGVTSDVLPIVTSTLANSGSTTDNGVILSDYMVPWPICRLPTLTSAKVYGDDAVVGFENDDCYAWLNKGDQFMTKISCVRTNSATTNDVSCHIRVALTSLDGTEKELVEAKETLLFTMNPATTATTTAAYLWFSIPRAGWYGLCHDTITLTGPSAAITASNVEITSMTAEAKVFLQSAISNSDSLSYLGIFNGTTAPAASSNTDAIWIAKSSTMHNPNTSGDRSIGQWCRNNAASLLLTNYTPAIARGGMIETTRIKFSANPLSTLTQVALSAQVDYRLLPAETGAFTFVVPERRRLEFEQYNWAPSANASVMVDLKTLNDMYIHLCLILPSPGSVSGTTNLNNFQLTYDECIEFEEGSRRYAKGQTTFKMQDYSDAVALFNSRAIWWYENPSHAAQVFEWLKKAMLATARGLKTVLPIVGPALSTAFPMAGPAIQAARLASTYIP